MDIGMDMDIRYLHGYGAMFVECLLLLRRATGWVQVLTSPSDFPPPPSRAVALRLAGRGDVQRAGQTAPVKADFFT